MGAAESAYATLRQEILSGSRSMGERLREEEVGAAIGISRTPVREAFRRLAAEGLIEYEPNRGVKIASWSARDVDEIFHIRELLEPYACRLVASRGQVDFDRLEGFATDMEREAAGTPPDLGKISELNNLFHSQIVLAAENDRLVAIHRSVVHVPLVMSTFGKYTATELAASMSQHRDIVAALSAQDPDWAEAAMRAHLLAGLAVARRQAEARGDAGAT
ncbi:MAG: transcriptional regulator, GntR family [Marmoricola sp.]|nr:transcriptional regulator, GntR family [Marmoricola sp.]